MDSGLCLRADQDWVSRTGKDWGRDKELGFQQLKERRPPFEELGMKRTSAGKSFGGLYEGG